MLLEPCKAVLPVLRVVSAHSIPQPHLAAHCILLLLLPLPTLLLLLPQCALGPQHTLLRGREALAACHEQCALQAAADVEPTVVLDQAGGAVRTV